MNISNQNLFYRLMSVNRTYLIITGVTYLTVIHPNIVLAENLHTYKSTIQLEQSHVGVLKTSKQSIEAQTEESSDSEDCD